MGPVNMRAIDEYKKKKEKKFDEFQQQVSQIRQEKLKIEDMIESIEEKTQRMFHGNSKTASKKFQRVFHTTV